ncbi:helix-turn-helix domain-containing protein [Porcincola intestinalis]|uniref:Helix-turn-helix transcriptional regulator n=1 Tax=Porcincola intestinalis TaxID=2606632 RepID=A0A6L5X5X0_9FIRM|nr:helix-turn-helix transcriptional regulator [Porcincola intestinalis]MSS14887.1 helix-turn-helix transcriptional regulator [Porcincola intestinalis]
MSRQFDEAMEGRFDIYGEEYRLVEPENIDELIRALEVKAALETYLSGLMHDEEPGGYDDLLQEQEGYIKEYIDSLGEYDNSHLISNINYFLRKLNLRMGELEQLIGVSAGYISRTAKENSAKKLSIDVVWKIARLFEIDIRTLIEADLMIPNSNAKLVTQFLDKLCKQTARNDIKWENRGGAVCYLSDTLRNTEVFTEEENGKVVYHANDHMNPDYKFVLADDVYTCASIVDGKEFAMIGFGIDGKKDSYFFDFVFLTPMMIKGKPGYIVEKAFYSSDDRFRVIENKGEELMHLVQSQEMDAEISPEVRSIIADYLK